MTVFSPESLKSYRFKVLIDTNYLASFASFSGVSMVTEVVYFRGGNRLGTLSAPHYGLSKLGNVSFRMGVAKDDYLLKWLNQSCSFDFDMPTQEYSRDPGRDIEVIVIDDYGNDRMKWILKKAVPVKYNVAQMAGSETGSVIENLEFAIEGFQKIDLKPKDA